jgi:3-methyladenine DNA glycosylase AlkD
MASVRAILKKLQAAGSAENLAGMARYGIDVADAYGVPTPMLRTIAKECGRDHALALALWASGKREAQLLAALVADPKALTVEQMDAWVADFRSWDVCDGCAIHLFRKSTLAWPQAWAWARREEEFVRRAGFALFATLAVHDKKADDERFEAVLRLIEEYASDDRNFVKKAVNWALRQIGKRNQSLCLQAIEVAQHLTKSKSTSVRWVGKDALRELLRTK